MSDLSPTEVLIGDAKQQMTQFGAAQNHVVQGLIVAIHERDEELFSLKEQRRRDLMIFGQIESKIEAIAEKIIPLMKRVQLIEERAEPHRVFDR